MAFGKRGVGHTRSNLAPPPHWMKQMEEKYQRLHAKIHNQAMRFASRRHTGTWARAITTEHNMKDTGGGLGARRSAAVPNDLLQSGGANCGMGDRTREMLSVESAVEPAYEEIECDSAISARGEGVGYNTSTAGCLTRRGEEESSCSSKENTRVELDLTVSSLETRRDSTAGSSNPGFDSSSTVYSDNPSLRPVSGEVTQFHGQKGISNRLLNIENETEIENVVPRNSPLSAYDEIEEESGQMELGRARRRRRDLRAVKTHRSRISHKTSQSCPASFLIHEGHGFTGYSLRGNGSFADGDVLYNDREQPQLFARMSIEARHAVDELRAEDKLLGSTNANPDEDPRSENNDNIDDPIKHSGRSSREMSHRLNEMVTSSSDPTRTPDFTQRNMIDITTGRSDGVTKNAFNKTFPPAHLGSSIDELRQRLHNADNKKGNRKLPQLGNGTAHHQDLPRMHLPLPDIGHYREPVSFRENTFEITPVDFDIRFHQIIPYNPGDTPPPDIRNQAIEKCKHWLIRHTPRH